MTKVRSLLYTKSADKNSPRNRAVFIVIFVLLWGYAMELQKTSKLALHQKFEKIKKAPEGFTLFVSIHDFIEYIESTSSFDVFLKGGKSARAKEIPGKYFSLKQIYQGIEDLSEKSTADLGHDRYVAIRELTLIKKNELSENNSFWKRRETFRKLIGEVYKTLDEHLSATASL